MHLTSQFSPATSLLSKQPSLNREMNPSAQSMSPSPWCLSPAFALLCWYFLIGTMLNHADCKPSLKHHALTPPHLVSWGQAHAQTNSTCPTSFPGKVPTQPATATQKLALLGSPPDIVLAPLFFHSHTCPGHSTWYIGHPYGASHMSWHNLFASLVLLPA